MAGRCAGVGALGGEDRGTAPFVMISRRARAAVRRLGGQLGRGEKADRGVGVGERSRPVLNRGIGRCCLPCLRLLPKDSSSVLPYRYHDWG
jgi:hypothetical protein